MLKKISRYISCTLTAAMVMTCAAPVLPVSAATFRDVSKTACEDAVKNLSDQGIISGYPDGTFRPKESITRAEISKILSSVMVNGYDSEAAAKADEKTQHADITNTALMTENGCTYTDVTGDDWAAQYIGVSNVCGIVQGYTDKTFRPSGNITYNELSAMAVRACEYDMSKVTGSWPANYIAAAQELNLYKGIKDFNPEEKGSEQATRGDSAIIINNALKTILTAAADGYQAARTAIPETDEEGNLIETPVLNVKALSLEDAIEIMQTTGMLAETAVLNKEADKVTIKSYKEYTSNLREMQDASAGEMDPSLNGVETKKKKLVMMRDFAEANLENNYQAELNGIEQQTRQLYFGLLQAQENVSVCQESVTIQEELLSVARKKHELGMISDLALSSQEYELISAKNSLIQAQQTADSTRDQFDLLLDLPTGTELTLTTPLEKQYFEIPQLQEAIDSKIENNLTVKQTALTVDIMEASVKSLRYTVSTSSSTYKSALNQLEQLKTGYEQLKSSINTEMTTSYFKLAELENQISTFESTIELTEKSLAVQELQYQLGQITASDLDQTKLSLLQAKQGLMAAIVEYNSAISDFNFSMGPGTERITFQDISLV